MTPEQFTYWLQGFMEMTHTKDITPEQLEMIKEHLKTVFDKQTPRISDLVDLGPNPLIC